MNTDDLVWNGVVHFQVSGHPVGRESPKKGKHGWYTPKKTRNYYDVIRKCFLSNYHKINDEDHKWKLKVMVYVCGEKHPDVTNVVKSVEDALEQFIWHNDRQIIETNASLKHVVKKDHECIVIKAERIG